MRRRTVPDAPHVHVRNLRDLPDALLANVAAFLPPPSPARVLFAIAVSTAPSSSAGSPWQPTTTSWAIVSSSAAPDQSEGLWQALDFGGIEKSLAAKLTDADVGAVLTCVDARNNLKSLKLAGCVNITGAGLSSLWGSTVLELIDLSLVGLHERPLIEPAPAISQAAVMPVLESILRSPGNSLGHLSLPLKWRSNRSPMLRRFLEAYEQILRNRRLKCSRCDRPCRRTNPAAFVRLDRGGTSYGVQVQEFSCMACAKYFCYNEDCFGLGLGDEHSNSCCRICERDYCPDCGPRGCTICKAACKGCSDKCGSCDNAVCEDCCGKCDRCNERRCSECGGTNKCRGPNCNKTHCVGCFDGKEFDVNSCEKCGASYCPDCRYVACSKNWENTCWTCAEMVGKRLGRQLADKQRKSKRHSQEIEAAIREIDELRLKNGLLLMMVMVMAVTRLIYLMA